MDGAAKKGTEGKEHAASSCWLSLSPTMTPNIRTILCALPFSMSRSQPKSIARFDNSSLSHPDPPNCGPTPPNNAKCSLNQRLGPVCDRQKACGADSIATDKDKISIKTGSASSQDTLDAAISPRDPSPHHWPEGRADNRADHSLGRHLSVKSSTATVSEESVDLALLPQALSQGNTTLLGNIALNQLFELPHRKGSHDSAASQPLPDGHTSGGGGLQSLGRVLFRTGERRRSEGSLVVGTKGRRRSRCVALATHVRLYVDKLRQLATENDRQLADLMARKEVVTSECNLLMKVHCNHRPCNMRQTNVALRIVDKTFLMTARYADAMYSYIQKQHSRVFRTAHAELVAYGTLEDMDYLWECVQTSSDKCVSRANEGLRAVYKNLFGLVHVVERHQKFVLFSSDFSDEKHGMLPRPSHSETTSIVHSAQLGNEHRPASKNADHSPPLLVLPKQEGMGEGDSAMELPYQMKNVPVTVPEGRPKIIYTRFFINLNEEHDTVGHTTGRL